MNKTKYQEHNATSDFADLEGDLDAELSAPEPRHIKRSFEDNRQGPRPQFEGERHACEKCGGTGEVTFGYRYVRTGKCFKCNGSGFFKTSAAARRLAKENRIKNKERKAIAWFEAHPEITKWINESAPKFEFAASLREAVNKYGSLTDNQLAAAEKCVAKSAARKAEWAAKDAARNVEVPAAAAIVAAFNVARSNGIKSPKLTIGSFKFSRAKDTSQNPGCLYVKHADEYAGKITPEGKLIPLRSVEQSVIDELGAISADLAAAVKAHGLKTINCSCCNRELTNAESRELGIGPICREKWGF